jgi:hypothetical protein
MKKSTKNKACYVVEYKYIYVVDMFNTEFDINTDVFITKQDAIEHAKLLRSYNPVENYPNFDIKIYKQELIQWE